MKLFLLITILFAAVLFCSKEEKMARGLKMRSIVDTAKTGLLPKDLHAAIDTGRNEIRRVPARTGDTVRSGVFTYLVEKVSYSDRIKSGSMSETPRGVFILVTLLFVNGDKNPHAIDKSLVRLLNGTGSPAECSGVASDLLAMSGKTVLCSRICKAGEALKGILVFDVPSRNDTCLLRVSNGAWKEETKDIFLTAPGNTTANSIP